jgi:plastocyanin
LTARAARAGLGILFAAVVTTACGPDAELRPDERLQEELGFSPREEVHRVVVTGGESESVAPAEVVVPPGAWVEFVSGDSWVHEIRFDVDSLSAGGLRFLTETDQLASPPMVDVDSRFIVSLEGAPEGRYPFQVEGSGRPARGAVVVRDGSS